MRHVLLLSMLLLGAAFAVGQNYPSQTDSSQTTTGDQTVIAGCLANANGNFQITDHNGKNWTLTGESAKLSEHVGHEVEIASTSRSVSESPNLIYFQRNILCYNNVTVVAQKGGQCSLDKGQVRK